MPLVSIGIFHYLFLLRGFFIFMKRTSFDFSKHEVNITKHDGVLIHEFKQPDTRNCMIVFINACGVLTVTGDLGNWVFCREFHPSANTENVSDGYWDEKLEIASQQQSKRYDSEETQKSLKEFRHSFYDNFGREMTEEEVDWVENLEYNIDDEYNYTHIAYRKTPKDIDYEYIPFGKKRHVWLSAIYDGFEAMCEKIKISESLSKTNNNEKII